MDESNLRRCMMALKLIDAFLDNQRGYRKTLGDLKGLLILIREEQPAFGRLLIRQWSLLHEFDAYMTYRRLPDLSLEERARIDPILTEIKSLILEAMGTTTLEFEGERARID